jgi:hypothetical protein
MDWQAAATELLGLVLTGRTFAPGFDWEAQWPALLDEVRQVVATDARIENEQLRVRLAQHDASFAAEQRLRDLGASEEDINTLRDAG